MDEAQEVVADFLDSLDKAREPEVEKPKEKKKRVRRGLHTFQSEAQRRAMMAARRGATNVPGGSPISVEAAVAFLAEALGNRRRSRF